MTTEITNSPSNTQTYNYRGKNLEKFSARLDNDPELKEYTDYMYNEKNARNLIIKATENFKEFKNKIKSLPPNYITEEYQDLIKEIEENLQIQEQNVKELNLVQEDYEKLIKQTEDIYENCQKTEVDFEIEFAAAQREYLEALENEYKNE